MPSERKQAGRRNPSAKLKGKHSTTHNKHSHIPSNGGNGVNGVGGQKITTFNEAPSFLQVPFILTGYRVGYSTPACFWSLLQVHNETVNIWSHLVGCIILMALMAHFIYWFSQYGIMHTLMPSIYLFGAAYGLFASTVFHWFNCIDSHCHLHLRTLDFGGIAANVIGGAWPISYYTFYCHHTIYWLTYCTILSIVSPLLMAIPILPWFHEHRILRTFLYIIPAGIPAYSYILFIILEGFSSEILTILYVPIFVSYLLFGLGMMVYLTRIPERFWPGAFDLLGTSHQIWHFFVIFGQWALYYGITETVQYRINTGCPVT